MKYRFFHERSDLPLRGCVPAFCSAFYQGNKRKRTVEIVFELAGDNGDFGGFVSFSYTSTGKTVGFETVRLLVYGSPFAITLSELAKCLVRRDKWSRESFERVDSVVWAYRLVATRFLETSGREML